MAKETIYVVVRPDGASMRMTEMQMKKMLLDGIHKPTKKARSTAQELGADFAKIPRRLIVAGGAALAFSATVGMIKRGIEGWNQALTQSKEILDSTVKSSRNLLQMLPAEEAARAYPELIREAKISPLWFRELAAIREGVYSLMTPEKGFGPAQRREAEMVARGFVRARGVLPEDIVEALGKAQFAFPGVSPTQMGNMFTVLMTQSAFIGTKLQELLPSLTKAYGPAAAIGMRPEDVLALTTVMTQYAGQPARATQAVAGIIQKLSANPILRRRLGITPGMGPEQIMGRLGQALEEGMTLTELVPGMGMRYAGRAALAFRPKGMREQAAMAALYREARVTPGIMERARWEERLRTIPELRAYELQQIAAEIPQLKGLERPRVIAETARALMEAFYAETTEGGRRGTFAAWVRRRGFGAAALVGGERWAVEDPSVEQIMNVLEETYQRRGPTPEGTPINVNEGEFNAEWD